MRTFLHHVRRLKGNFFCTSPEQKREQQMWLWCGVVTIVACVVAILSSMKIDLTPGSRPEIFQYLYALQEPVFAWGLMGFLGISIAVSRYLKQSLVDEIVGQLSDRPWPFLLFILLVLVVGAHLCYRLHPLSMDEYAPYFQSKIFASGKLVARLPPPVMERMVLRSPWFIEGSIHTGELHSVYWPGFALLITPFMSLGMPWLCNPLITVAALGMIWLLAKKMIPHRHAAGWALLFAAASASISVNGISYYNLNAHMLFSLLYINLLIEDDYGSLFLAGVVGSFALVLHNPFPHTVFALPWVISFLFRSQGVKKLSVLFAGYLPLVLFLGVGWMLLRADVAKDMSDQSVGSGGIIGIITYFADVMFAVPDSYQLWSRLAGATKLVLWSSPGIIVLAILGGRERWASREMKLLSLSGLVTFGSYLFVSADQGHGWGYRYFHSAMGVIPLLAASFVCSSGKKLSSFLLRALFTVSVVSLLLGTFVRFRQVQTFIDQHLVQLPATEKDQLTVTMVYPQYGYYAQDLVQNDPFLNNNRLIFFGRGSERDRYFMRIFFPGAEPGQRTKVAQTWVWDRGKFQGD